jgi:predicted amidophosphoribosyltransferase
MMKNVIIAEMNILDPNKTGDIMQTKIIKKCYNCGNQIEENQEICEYCGEDLDSENLKEENIIKDRPRKTKSYVTKSYMTTSHFPKSFKYMKKLRKRDKIAFFLFLILVTTLIALSPFLLASMLPDPTLIP